MFVGLFLFLRIMHTWLEFISYLFFLANNLAMDILMANDTIAMPTASPIKSVKMLIGGTTGSGKLDKKHIFFYTINCLGVVLVVHLFHILSTLNKESQKKTF